MHLLINAPELLHRRPQILHDLRRQHVGVGEVVTVLQDLVLQPEDVQADLVARQQVVIGEGAEALRLLPVVPVLRMVALDKVPQVVEGQRVGLQREVHIRAQVVNPQPLGPRPLPRRAAVEEEHVRLHRIIDLKRAPMVR